MNLKKVFAAVLAATMILSTMSFGVTATEDTIVLPANFIAEEITGDALNIQAVPGDKALSGDFDVKEDIALDFGMHFELGETREEAVEKPYYSYVTDFELTFDNDVTAILAGNHPLFSEFSNGAWVTIKSEEKGELGDVEVDFDGIKFKANETHSIMSYIDSNFTYKDLYDYNASPFYCGVKLGHDAPNGVVAKLALVMYPTVVVDRDVEEYDYVIDGIAYKVDRTNKQVLYTVEMTYGENAFDINTTDTDAEKAEALNEAVIDTKEAAVGAANIIASLNQEAKKEISPEVIKNIIETQAGEAIEEPTVAQAYATDADSVMTITVSDVEEEDAEAAFTGTDIVLDVTVTENGTEVNEINTPVLVAIPVDNVNLVEKVLHIHKGALQELAFTKGTKVIYVQMSEFSQIAVVMGVELATGEAVLGFDDETKLINEADQERGKAYFDLVIEGTDFDTIKGFLSGEFTLKAEALSAKGCDYEIIPANAETDIDFDLNQDGSKSYRINLNSFDKAASWTMFEANAEIDTDGTALFRLGTLVVSSYGTGSVNFKGTTLMNQFDNEHNGQNISKPITVVGTKNAIFDIDVPTQTLTINVDFVHSTKTDNSKDYQQMWLEITGGDIVGKETIELGRNVPGVIVADNKYTVTKTLLANTDYDIVLKGVGYRTARYMNLNMGEEDRVLNFWNNYEDEAKAMEWVGLTAKGINYNYNFLAGDIVMDNYIDIYDLSAVVSYFGEDNLIGTNNAYAKYDLNRDGKINSVDVAIVLTSWNK